MNDLYQQLVLEAAAIAPRPWTELTIHLSWVTDGEVDRLEAWLSGPKPSDSVVRDPPSLERTLRAIAAAHRAGGEIWRAVVVEARAEGHRWSHRTRLYRSEWS